MTEATSETTTEVSTEAAAPAATLLSSAPTEVVQDWTTTVPDKFKADGEINHQAIYQGYQQLESRMRDVGLPPEAADKYELTYPDGTTDDAKIPAEHLTGLQQYAFDNAYSQKQFAALATGWQKEMESFESQLIDKYNLDPAKQVEIGRAALLETFKDQATLDKNLTQAANALIKIVPDAATRNAISDKLGNDPDLIKALAQFGSTLREDAPLPPTGGHPAEDMTKLMASPAATNPHHPEYAITRAKISAYYSNGGRSIRVR